MLQVIYQNSCSDIQQLELAFQQHYIFLKVELRELFTKLIESSGSNQYSVEYVNEKLTDTCASYLNYFSDKFKGANLTHDWEGAHGKNEQYRPIQCYSVLIY